MDGEAGTETKKEMTNFAGKFLCLIYSPLARFGFTSP